MGEPITIDIGLTLPPSKRLHATIDEEEKWLREQSSRLSLEAGLTRVDYIIGIALVERAYFYELRHRIDPDGSGALTGVWKAEMRGLVLITALGLTERHEVDVARKLIAEGRRLYHVARGE